MELRLIRYSNENGSREGVYFTEDFEMESSDVCPPGCTIDSDTTIEVDNFPATFPLDYNLERN